MKRLFTLLLLLASAPTWAQNAATTDNNGNFLWPPVINAAQLSGYTNTPLAGYNTTNGAFWLLTTNGHFRFRDEYGTTNDFTTNGFAIIQTNGNSFVYSNGTLTLNGQAVLTAAGQSGTTNAIIGQLLAMGANDTNFTLSASNVLRSLALTVGQNATNDVMVVSNVLSALAYTLGQNGTNYANAINSLASGYATVAAGNMGAAATNDIVATSNSLALLIRTNNGSSYIPSNAIANLAGSGTNTTLQGTTQIGAVTVYGQVNYNTNQLTVTGSFGGSLDGIYTWTNLQGASVGGITNGVFWRNNGAGVFAIGSYLGTNYMGEMYDVGQFYTNAWIPSTCFVEYVGSTNMIGIYPPSECLVADEDATNAITVSWTHSVLITTNGYLLMGGVGPNGSQILWPDGCAIYGESWWNPQQPGDGGLYLGASNGEIYAESYSSVFASLSDIAGSPTAPITASSILGGVNNTIGAFPGVQAWYGSSYSTIIGGASNVITGSESVSLGSMNNVTNNGVLMWNDGSSGPKWSLTNNSVELWAQHGLLVNGQQVPTAPATPYTGQLQFTFGTNSASGVATITLTNTFYITNGLIMTISQP